MKFSDLNPFSGSSKAGEETIIVEPAPLNPVMSAGIVNMVDTIFNGEKFISGLGPAAFQPTIDFHFLRAYSWKLFYENSYARGIIKRLKTNEIGTGLRLESSPIANLLGLSREEVVTWSRDTEERFQIWSEDARQVDWSRQMTFGELQENARLHALLSGDVLVVLRYPAPLNLPVIELIDGARISTPFPAKFPDGNKIIDGVEVDSKGRHVAFHVVDTTQTLPTLERRRIPAFGARSGRRMAWMIYSGERRLGQTRGVPLLASVLQSLKEIDRYRDAEQRAALVNAWIALSVERENATVPGSRPMTGGATRRDAVIKTDGDGKTSSYDFAAQIPGVQIEGLAAGEKLVSHSTARPNVNFGTFEEAILSGIAWGEEIPPEILKLSFSSNYSASKAAVNEFKIYLNRIQLRFANALPKPIYEEWLLSMVLIGKISAAALIESRRDAKQRDIALAWLRSTWPGPTKPSVDLGKDVDAYVKGMNQGLVTRERAAADLFGTKYDENIKRLNDENNGLVDAFSKLVDAGLIKPITLKNTKAESDIDFDDKKDNNATIIDMVK